jgi:hypothetical protein
LNERGEATEGTVGLWVADVPWNAPGKGNPCGPALVADEVGIGGEKGKGGYWFGVCLLKFEGAGEIDGGGAGSSSPKDTPSALSLASFNSLT